MHKGYGNGNDYYFGTPAEIKSIYKAIVRHYSQTDIYPLFVGFPKFSDLKAVYGLEINSDNQMVVLNSDTIADMILNDDIMVLS